MLSNEWVLCGFRTLFLVFCTVVATQHSFYTSTCMYVKLIAHKILLILLILFLYPQHMDIAVSTHLLFYYNMFIVYGYYIIVQVPTPTYITLLPQLMWASDVHIIIIEYRRPCIFHCVYIVCIRRVIHLFVCINEYQRILRRFINEPWMAEHNLIFID